MIIFDDVGVMDTGIGVTDEVVEAGIGVTDEVVEACITITLFVGVFEAVRRGERREVNVGVVLSVRAWLEVEVGVIETLAATTAAGVKSADTATYVSPAPTTIAQTERELFCVEGAVQANLKDDNVCLELCVTPPVHRDICRK